MRGLKADLLEEVLDWFKKKNFLLDIALHQPTNSKYQGVREQHVQLLIWLFSFMQMAYFKLILNSLSIAKVICDLCLDGFNDPRSVMPVNDRKKKPNAPEVSHRFAYEMRQGVLLCLSNKWREPYLVLNHFAGRKIAEGVTFLKEEYSLCKAVIVKLLYSSPCNDVVKILSLS